MTCKWYVDNTEDLHVQKSPLTILYKMVGKPLTKCLQGKNIAKIFVVLPYNTQYFIPFALFKEEHDEALFVDRYLVNNFPSVLSLKESVTGNLTAEVPGKKGDFLVVGGPTTPEFVYDTEQWNLDRLPFAEREALNVASILGTTPVLREQATKQNILYRLRSAKIAHFATHGSASKGFLVFTSSLPVPKSGVANGENILIFPNDIWNPNEFEKSYMSLALVTLSSCYSGKRQPNNDVLYGMANAFLLAGAYSVLVASGKVPDESANIFMQYFYQFLVNGVPSYQALQRSRQCMRCFHEFFSDVHWSGFNIIGKELTLYKNHSVCFPIQHLVGEVSVFPRPLVTDIMNNLLNNNEVFFSSVQVCYF